MLLFFSQSVMLAVVIVRVFVRISFALSPSFAFCVCMHWMKVVCVDLSQTYTQTDRYACTHLVSFFLRFPMPFWLRLSSHSRFCFYAQWIRCAFVCEWVSECVLCICVHTPNLIVLTLFAMTFYDIRFFFNLYSSTFAFAAANKAYCLGLSYCAQFGTDAHWIPSK